MAQNNCNDVAFISASTIFSADKETINAHVDSENKNSEVYSHPELFY
jgi:hypothetical protein